MQTKITVLKIRLFVYVLCLLCLALPEMILKPVQTCVPGGFEISGLNGVSNLVSSNFRSYNLEWGCPLLFRIFFPFTIVTILYFHTHNALSWHYPIFQLFGYVGFGHGKEQSRQQ